MPVCGKLINLGGGGGRGGIHDTEAQLCSA